MNKIQRKGESQRRMMALYRWIRIYQTTRHRSPSYREMATFLHTSTSVVNFFMHRLENDGLIEREKTLARSIYLVPMMGKAEDQNAKQ